MPCARRMEGGGAHLGSRLVEERSRAVGGLERRPHLRITGEIRHVEVGVYARGTLERRVYEQGLGRLRVVQVGQPHVGVLERCVVEERIGEIRPSEGAVAERGARDVEMVKIDARVVTLLGETARLPWAPPRDVRDRVRKGSAMRPPGRLCPRAPATPRSSQGRDS